MANALHARPFFLTPPTHTFALTCSLSLSLAAQVKKTNAEDKMMRMQNATQGQILSQSPTDATRFWWHLYGS